mmetsp:Transcript_49293/g.130618  ORF Transcript_49293/g.130618 Transcript_49293/m.130618 type:complete len:204 (+) Transcript_49293:897-1508(+)
MNILCACLQFLHVQLRVAVVLCVLVNSTLQQVNTSSGHLQRVGHMHQSLLDDVHHCVRLVQIVPRLAPIGRQEFELFSLLIKIRRHALLVLPKLGGHKIRSSKLLAEFLHICRNSLLNYILQIENEIVGLDYVFAQFVHLAVRDVPVPPKSTDILVGLLRTLLELTDGRICPIQSPTTAINFIVLMGEVVDELLHPPLGFLKP